MKTAAQTTFAERLGRTLGRAWRSCARLDRRAQGWLLARGWAPGIAKAALLAVKLAAISVLLYTACLLYTSRRGGGRAVPFLPGIPKSQHRYLPRGISSDSSPPSPIQKRNRACSPARRLLN